MGIPQCGSLYSAAYVRRWPFYWTPLTQAITPVQTEWRLRSSPVFFHNVKSPTGIFEDLCTCSKVNHYSLIILLRPVILLLNLTYFYFLQHSPFQFFQTLPPYNKFYNLFFIWWRSFLVIYMISDFFEEESQYMGNECAGWTSSVMFSWIHYPDMVSYHRNI